MSAVLVLDDAVGDPIADVLTRHPIDGLAIVQLSDFLKTNGVAYDNESGRLTRALNQSESYDRILDRVVEISPLAIENFSGGKSSLQRGQLYSAYEELKTKTEMLSEGRQYTGLGKLVPLPTQWFIIAKNLPHVATPSFRYGYGPEVIDAEGLREPIHKSPFDLYTWKPNERVEGFIWDDFIVSRPAGKPVLAYKLNDSVKVEALDGSEVGPTSCDLLANLTVEALDLFSANIGEVLWFLDDDRAVFAAFSHFLAGAAKSPQFENEARRYLNSFMPETNACYLGNV
jgi:hypothetical protein